MEKYRDRKEAGQVLAKALNAFEKKADAIVLALPRGGVPVAYEIATALSLPLDVFIVRKLGMPGHEELAMGAIASGSTIVFNEDILRELHVAQSAIDRVIASENAELERRELVYRGDRPFPTIENKIVILVDDGIATGATMKAAIKALKKQKPKQMIVAVPVAAYSTCNEIAPLVDKLVCPLKPTQFYAVGAWYDYFDQTSDEEVRALLKS